MSKTSGVAERNEFFSAMNEGRPVRSYIKTILGKVSIVLWDSYTNTRAEQLLSGDPRRKDPDSIVNMWSEKEDAFFKTMNRRHFTNGTLIPYEMPVEQVREKTVEESSDVELKEVLTKPFFTLQAVLNKTESIAVLFRILGLAKEMDKSDKVIRAIESRLSEIQQEPAPTMEFEEE